MKLFRKTLFWVHLVVGLTVGLGIATLATTGLLMAFEHPLVDRYERFDGSPPAGVRATDADKVASLADRVSAAVDAGPTSTPTAITVTADLTRPAAVLMGRDRVTYVNNFTGKVVGTSSDRLRGFFRTTLAVHRWLAMTGVWHDRARWVTGLSTIGFLLLIVSGVYLWLPRRFRWASFKPVLLPSLRLKGKARDWNWHNVVGFWLALPLLIIATTGLVFAYPWANRAVFRLFGEAPPVRAEANRTETARPRANATGTRRTTVRREVNLDGVDDLWAAAVKAAAPGWTSMSMRLGTAPRAEANATDDDDAAAPTAATPMNGTRRAGKSGGGGSVVFTLGYGDVRVPLNRVTLTFNRKTGQLVRTERFADNTVARRARLLVLPIHRGEILGLPGMTIAAVSCAGAMLLVYTGFALSWRRLVRPILRRRKAHVAASANAEAELVAV